MSVDLSALRTGTSGRTKDFEFVQGEYAIAGERIPYFAISMSVNEAIQHLTLASNLAVDPADPVKIDELIQRDVQRTRAEGEIVHYLKESGRLKFFNSFTVVLMPLNARGRPIRNFAPTPEGEESSSVDAQGLEVTQAGPVRIRQLPGQSFGFLSWDTGSAAAVIIDGQHRFLALKSVRDDLPQHLSPDQTKVPILILVLDERAGFRSTHEGPEDVVRASRAIFTDINKYAVKVSAEREYLLDDLSLKAVAMRAIISSGIGKTTTESLSEPARIPLALVDWAGPRQPKFEDGPFISSVQAMHTLVAGLLGADISTEPDPSNYLATQKWLEVIHARLGVEDENWAQNDILSRLQIAESEAMPFRLHAREVDAAAKAFAEGLGQVCVQFLLRADPYDALIQQYLEAGLLGGDAEYWLGQGENARLGWQAQFGLDPEPTARAIHETVKRDFYYAYLIVFQRGFVMVGRNLFNAHEHVLEAWEFEGEYTHAALIDEWISRFNRVIAPLLSRGSEEFWLGTAVRADRRIEYGARGLNSVVGLSQLLLLPHDEAQSFAEADDQRLLTGDENDDILALLDTDAYRFDNPSEGQVAWVARWRGMLDSQRPGRASGGELAQVRRTAARNYRDGLRRHITEVANAANRPLTDEQRDRLVLAFGARRLAGVLTGSET